ncbi:hypothetical protein [uncultured Cyclobacterium sp.]|uniref:hypothetical protein n=1 Tax=uncultured Cyclobacterium sp. TaxID=453820 RepID=UPI0030EE0EFF|tara:strand:+ start:9067 stop:9420 length:354 start_codon:yes stop_codon:yes gene_type:complete
MQRIEQKNKKHLFSMRLVIAIMLPIVLSLSLLPCCPPADNCSDDNGRACADATEQGTLPNSGLCSPFFTCGHCPGFVLQQVEFPPLPFQKVSQTTFSKITEFKPFSLVKLFFKPPKV